VLLTDKHDKTHSLKLPLGESLITHDDEHNFTNKEH